MTSAVRRRAETSVWAVRASARSCSSDTSWAWASVSWASAAEPRRPARADCWVCRSATSPATEARSADSCWYTALGPVVLVSVWDRPVSMAWVVVSVGSTWARAESMAASRDCAPWSWTSVCTSWVRSSSAVVATSTAWVSTAPMSLAIL